jgi:hypothetical protein
MYVRRVKSLPARAIHECHTQMYEKFLPQPLNCCTDATVSGGAPVIHR